MRKISMLCLFSIFLLNACNDPKSASKGNFKHVINQHLQTEGRSCIEFSGTLPSDVLTTMLQNRVIGPPYLALESAGLLRSSDIQIDQPFVKGPGRRFELTDLGKKYAMPAPYGHDVIWLCYAQKSVHSVGNWTEPSGGTTEVRFSYQLDDLADWARRPDVQSAYGLIQTDLNGAFDGSKPALEKILLQRTNQGWEVWHP